MKIFFILIGNILSLIYLSSCATIFKDKAQIVQIDSNVKNAKIKIGEKFIGKTPFTGKILKAKNPTITLSKKGYKTRKVKLNTELSPLFYLDLIGIFGAITDLSGNKMYNYEPGKLQIDLVKTKNNQQNLDFCRARLFSFIRHNFESWVLQVIAGDGPLLRTAYKYFKTNNSLKFKLWVNNLNQILQKENMPREISCLWSNSLGKAPNKVKSKHPWFPNINLKKWGEKKYASLVFAGADPKTPASTFGHSFLVAHDQIPPEPDALILEYIGITNNNPLMQLKAFFFSITGVYRLKYFIDKRMEYETEDRSLWFYTLPQKYKSNIFKRLKKLVSKQHSYQFIFYNCSDGINRIQTGESGLSVLFPNNLIPEKIINQGQLISSNLAKTKYFYSKLSKQKQGFYDEINFSKYGLSFKKPDDKTETLFLLMSLPYLARRSKSPIKTQDYLIKFVAIAKKTSSKTIANNLPDFFQKKNSYARIKRHQISIGNYLNANRSNLNPGIEFSFRLGEFDFSSSHQDFFENSTINFLKFNFMARWNSFDLSEVILYKMDAAEPASLFKSQFVRYIDLSYTAWKALYPDVNTTNEFVMKYGYGLAYKIFGSKATFITNIIGGLSFTKNTEHNNPRTYLHGQLRGALRFNFFKFPKLNLEYFWTPFAPNNLWKHQFDLTMLLLEYGSFSISSKTRIYSFESKLNKKPLISNHIYLNYFF